jgi:MFS family permease
MVADYTPDQNPFTGLLAVNAASFFSQSVQIGALPALLGLVLAERGLDPLSIGVVATAPWLAILLLSRIVPRMLARIGLLAGVVASVVVSATATILMAVVENILVIFLLNVCVGVGLIIRWIACDTWVVALAPKDKRGRAIGVHETVMGLGIAAGPLVLSTIGIKGTLPFVTCTLLLLATLPWLLVLRARNRRLEPDEEHAAIGFRALFTVMPIGLIGAFEAGFVETSVVALMAVTCTGLGFDAVMGTLLLTASGMGATLLQLPIGWIADRLSGRAAQILCATIILAGAAAIPTALGWPWLAAVLVFIWGGAIGGMNTLAVMEAGEEIGDRHMSSAMMAVAFCYTLGSMLGPTLSGAFMEHVSVHGLMLAAGGISIVFLVAAASMRPPPHPVPDAVED